MEAAAPTNPHTDREVAMSTFTATVSAMSAGDAVTRVQRHLAKVEGFSMTGRAQVRSEKHRLWTVEITDEGGDKDDLWVVLTSYGISPDEALGSVWQTVPGVGC